MQPYTGHGWSRRGERTAIPVRPGYQNFYVNAAVIPTTGQLYQEQHARMNTETFQGFLERLAHAWADYDVYLVLDRAGWHRAKRLCWPANLRPLYLPAYSPELNPVERLWLRAKAVVLRNRLFEDLLTQQEAVHRWFASQSTTALASLCACPYLV